MVMKQNLIWSIEVDDSYYKKEEIVFLETIQICKVVYSIIY